MRETATRIRALVAKELLALLKDPKSRTVVFVPPVVQLIVFGYAATYDLNDVPFAVYNEDPGFASRRVIARFQGSTNFEQVAAVDHLRDIPPLIDGREALLVLHVGPDFTRDVLAGRQGQLQVILDGRNSNTALIAQNYARTIVGDFNEDWIDGRGRRALPARLEVRAWFNANLHSRWFIVPGIVGLLTLVVTILVTSLSVAREREQGTFDQLLVAPYHPAEILVGKALPGFFIGLFEATLIITLAVLWFEVPLRGSLAALYAGLMLFLLAVIGVGLMISSLSVTQQQGLLGAFLFIVPAVILSGFATPIANMPEVVQKITLLNPLRYFMVILRGVFLQATPVELLAQQLWPMAVIGTVTLMTSAWLFRRRMH